MECTHISSKVVTCITVKDLTENIDENHLKGKIKIKIRPEKENFNGDFEIGKNNRF